MVLPFFSISLARKLTVCPTDRRVQVIVEFTIKCKTRVRSLAHTHLPTGRTGLNAGSVEVRTLSTSIEIV